MKRSETYEELPVMSDDRYAELAQWRKKHDRRYFDVLGKYAYHPAANYASVWLHEDSELLRKILTILFDDLSDDEKIRRLDIIAPLGGHYM